MKVGKGLRVDNWLLVGGLRQISNMTIKMANLNVWVVAAVIKSLTDANIGLLNNLDKAMKMVTVSIITLFLSVVLLRDKIFKSVIPRKFEL